MALIKCPECGGMVSDEAKKCPHCGTPVIIQTKATNHPRVALPKNAENNLSVSKGNKITEKSFFEKYKIQIIIAIALVLILGIIAFLTFRGNKIDKGSVVDSDSIAVDSTVVVDTATVEQESVSSEPEEENSEEYSDDYTEDEAIENTEEIEQDNESPTPVTDPIQEEDDNKIYDVVDKKAQFPNGDEACYRWLASHIKYPTVCAEQGIQGRVFVGFVVNTDGSIVDVKITKSPDDNLSKEAIRVVNAMPRWNAARLGNKAVRSRMNLPIMFRLN